MLMNRQRKFKTWVDGEYIHGEYNVSVFDIVSEYIMFHVFNMNYYWSYAKGLGFMKVYDLEYLMDN
jgi:hypothetical protein